MAQTGSDFDLMPENYDYRPAFPEMTTSQIQPQESRSSHWIWVISGVLVIIVLVTLVLFTKSSRGTTPNGHGLDESTKMPVFNQQTQKPANNVSMTRQPMDYIATQECQGISERYGTFPGNWKGAVYKEVKDVWNKNKCKTIPSSFTCQNISDAFNIGPNSVHKWGMEEIYKQKGCTTIPQMTCQMISDTYDVYPGHAGRLDTLQGVEKDVLKSAWENMECQTVPTRLTCQGLSNFYMMSEKTPGLAANYPQVYGYFRNKGCITEPLSCEYISQQYRVPEQAPPLVDNIHAAWYNQKCKTTPAPKGYISIKNMTNDAADEYVNKNLHHAVEYCDATAQCVGIEYDKATGLYKTKHQLKGKKAEHSNFYRKI
jgi:hypothetical protein